MTINLADNSPRIDYTVAAGVTQTSFTVPFEFFTDADLNVFVDDAAKTLTTDYTVTGGDGSTGSITMSVTGAAGGSRVVITRSIGLERTTDFPTSGAFDIASLNTELDKLVAIAADLKDNDDRSLKLTDSDVAAATTLPTRDSRKGKVLAFNETTGAVESGPTISDVQSVANAAADIQTLAHIEDGTTATNAIQTAASNSANIATVGGISNDVTTVAGISSNVTTVAGETTNLANVTSNLTAIQNAATNASTASTKATEAATSASNAASSASSATSSASTATTKASEAAASQTAAASSASSASTSAATATTKAAEAATSAGNASTSETNSAASATAAASSATAAAASQTAAAASAASAATAFDNFDDTYLGAKSSNPTQDNDGNALVSGALYFNSTANEMRVYDGANWIAATSAGNVSLILYEYTATAGQTTFSGSDDNSATLSYTVDNLQVVMNGIILDPSDFTATNGTSVVLASGAAANDLVNIYAFKSFTTADMVSKTSGGTFSGAVGFSGGITGDVSFDTDTLHVDAANNTVGIGTTSPGFSNGSGLEVANSTTACVRIEGNSAAHAVEIYADSNGGTIDARGSGAVLAFDIGGSEAARIDASGHVGINNATPGSYLEGELVVGNSTKDQYINVVTGTGNAAGLCFQDTTGTSIVGGLRYTHSDNALASWTNGSPRMVIDGSGNTLINCSSARSQNTAVSSGILLQVKGDIVPDVDAGNVGHSDLGDPSYRFEDVYSRDAVTTGSDQNEKQQIASLTTAEMTAAKAISKLFKTFKWNDAVAAKGDAARTHAGVMAQQVATAVSDAGLDAADYAFFMSNTWYEDANGNIVDADTEGATQRTRHGIRYHELLAFIGAATEQRLADLETRVAALEAGS